MKKLIMAAITATVVIIVLAGCLMPVMEDATATHETFTNDGRYYVDTSIDDDVTITMSYDIEDSVRSWYIDGVLLEYDTVEGVEFVGTPTVVGADNLVYRSDGRSRGLYTNIGSSDYTVYVTSAAITQGSITSNAPLFVASTTETDYIMRYSPDLDTYILGDSDIIACGYTDLSISDDSKVSTVITISGNVDDGVEITTYNSTYEFTTSNIELNVEEVDGYNDLYKFQSVTFDATYNDGSDDYVTSCTYSMVVLPAEVTAEKTIHFTDSENAILGIVPVMLIIALLVAIVALVIRNREM